MTPEAEQLAWHVAVLLHEITLYGYDVVVAFAAVYTAPISQALKEH